MLLCIIRKSFAFWIITENVVLRSLNTVKVVCVSVSLKESWEFNFALGLFRSLCDKFSNKAVNRKLTTKDFYQISWTNCALVITSERIPNSL